MKYYGSSGYMYNGIVEGTEENYRNYSMGFPYKNNVDSNEKTWKNHSEIMRQSTQRSNDMSFIMMMNSLHGIVAVADSKSTVQNSVEEKNRRTQKVFKPSNYLLATWGNNRIIKSKIPIKVEDVLNLLIERFPDDFRKVLDSFQELLYENNHSMNDIYNFFVGGHYKCKEFPGNDGYFIKEYKVSSEGIDCLNSQQAISNCRYAGVVELMPRNLSINPNWDVFQLEEKGTLLLQSIIEIGDAFLPYNPVGGDIQVVSYTVEDNH